MDSRESMKAARGMACTLLLFAATGCGLQFRSPSVALNFDNGGGYFSHNYTPTGQVHSAFSTKKTITIRYSGIDPASNVTPVGLDSPFSFEGGAYPGTGGTCGTTIRGDCTIVVSVRPTATALFNDTFELQYDAPGLGQRSLTVDLSANGRFNALPTNTGVRGDANGNSAISVADVVLLSNFLALTAFNCCQLSLTDLNRDGYLSQIDIETLSDITIASPWATDPNFNRAVCDANGDGQITSADATAITNHLASSPLLIDPDLAAADCNQDGSVTAADATIASQVASGALDFPFTPAWNQRQP